MSCYHHLKNFKTKVFSKGISRKTAVLVVFLGIVIHSCSQITCSNWLGLPSYPSYVSVGDLDVPGNQITVEAVFMRTAPYVNGLIWAGDLVSKHNEPSDANYLLRPNNAEITTANGYFRTPDICEIELNKIYHAAMVYDGVTLKFYRNGFLMSSVPATGNMFQNNFQTRIGLYDALVHNTQLIGYINEVRIWNVARSQSQIRATMNTSLLNPAAQVGLLAYYTFDNLLNKQGNPSWDGTLSSNAFINQTIPNCTFLADSCLTLGAGVLPSFNIPDTVCLGTPVPIVNTTTGANTYFWNFCVADINQPPAATNIGNPGNLLSQPVFMDYVIYNGSYYGFLINHFPGKLVRLDYGSSLLNTPAAVDLGNFGGIIPPGYGAEGIQIVQNEGKWYAIIVGGYTPSGSTPRVLKIDFGPDLLNLTPVATDWGNVGTLLQPLDLHVFKEGNNWYGLTVNAENNTITRFSFTNSFDNTPTGVNLGGFGLLNYPTGIYAINDNGNWSVFVTNHGSNSRLVRLDFGNSLLNTPTAVNLGSIGNTNGMRDLTILRFCDKISGYAVNSSTNSIYRLEFADITSVPIVTNLGNIGNMNVPHSVSKLFRVNEDVYGFVTNVGNNTITRLHFPGCTNASIGSSSVQNPPPVIYNNPGVYNINLTIDDGMPTQASTCRQVVVVPEPQSQPLREINLCAGDSIKVGASNTSGNYIWNNGATTDSVFINTAGYYWVETSRYGCTARDSFLLSFTPRPNVQFGNDTIICPNDTILLDASNSIGSYQWSTGSTAPSIQVFDPGTYFVAVTENSCTASDTIVINTFTRPPITITPTTTICPNTSIQLQATGGNNYSWSPPGTLNNPNIDNPVAVPQTNTLYYVSITDANSCIYLDSVQVNIQPPPLFSVNGAGPVCLNDSIQLTASGGEMYSWAPVAGLSNPAIANPKASPSVTTDYMVTISEQVCNQSVSLPVQVTVLPLPNVQASRSVDIDCSNDQSQLNASGAVQYTWTPSSTLNNPQVPNPLARPRTTTQYIVAGRDAAGCINYDTVTVKVSAISEGGYVMPNAFTPNGDGLNDRYGIRYWGVIEEVEFSIFNRWGERIFYTKDPNQCWDGTYKGVKQDGNVFIYMIKAKTFCEPSVFRKGTFVLIR